MREISQSQTAVVHTECTSRESITGNNLVDVFQADGETRPSRENRRRVNVFPDNNTCTARNFHACHDKSHTHWSGALTQPEPPHQPNTRDVIRCLYSAPFNGIHITQQPWNACVACVWAWFNPGPCINYTDRSDREVDVWLGCVVPPGPLRPRSKQSGDTNKLWQRPARPQRAAHTRTRTHTQLTFPAARSPWWLPGWSGSPAGACRWPGAAGAGPSDRRFPCTDPSPAAPAPRSGPAASPAAPAGSRWSCLAPAGTPPPCWGSPPGCPSRKSPVARPWRRYPHTRREAAVSLPLFHSRALTHAHTKTNARSVVVTVSAVTPRDPPSLRHGCFVV